MQSVSVFYALMRNMQRDTSYWTTLCFCVTWFKAGRLTSVKGHCFTVTFHYISVLCFLDLDSIEFQFGLRRTQSLRGPLPMETVRVVLRGGFTASLHMVLLRHLRGPFGATDCPPAVQCGDWLPSKRQGGARCGPAAPHSSRTPL